MSLIVENILRSGWCLPQGIKCLIKCGTGDLRLTHGNPLLLHKRLFTTTGSDGCVPSYNTLIESNFFHSSMLFGYLQAAARREKRKPREVVPKKTCRRCDKSKDPKTEFYRDASGAGGLYEYCKSCVAVRVAPEFKPNIVVYVVHGPLATIKDTPLFGRSAVTQLSSFYGNAPRATTRIFKHHVSFFRSGSGHKVS
jgi:hypothetical protein